MFFTKNIQLPQELCSIGSFHRRDRYPFVLCAGERNRTPDPTLEASYFTTKLHPQMSARSGERQWKSNIVAGRAGSLPTELPATIFDASTACICLKPVPANAAGESFCLHPLSQEILAHWGHFSTKLKKSKSPV